MRVAIGVVILGAVLAGCQRSAPSVSQAPAPGPAVVTPSPRGLPAKTDMTLAERSTRYTQEHPWGEDTGTTRLHGTVTWAEGGGSPAALYRWALVLRGTKDTPSAGRFYRVRANAAGEYEFDRILGGDYELSDGLHWRLRIRVNDGEDRALDLALDNSIQVRDDFPAESKQG